MKLYDDVRAFGTMKTCSVCGKEFLVPDVSMWAYKQQKAKSNGVFVWHYFCTWSHMRKWEAENMPKRKQTYDTKELEVYSI